MPATSRRCGVHEFRPDKRRDHDECADCKQPFEDRIHPQIETVRIYRRLVTCKRGHRDRYNRGRCLECHREYITERRRVEALTRGTA